MSDYDRSIHSNPDAAAWAKFFGETFPPGSTVPDEGTMLGWFANAMMAMHDRLKKAPPPAPEEPAGRPDDLRARVSARAAELEAAAEKVPLGEALHGGSFDGAPRYDFLMLQARLLRNLLVASPSPAPADAPGRPHRHKLYDPACPECVSEGSAVLAADAPGEPGEVERALDTAAEVMERVASALHNGGGVGHEETRLLEAVRRIRALRRERSKK